MLGADRKKGAPPMFAYICLGTNDLDRATRFYDAVLGALGHARCDVSDEPDWQGWIGWGLYEECGAQQGGRAWTLVAPCTPRDRSWSAA